MSVEYACSLSTRSVGPASVVKANSANVLDNSALNVSRPGLLVPTPQLAIPELTGQVDALRAQLRDTRVTDSKQRSQIKNQAESIRDLKSSLQAVTHAREQVEIDLSNERKAHRATEKRLDVAAANHSRAIDRLSRQSIAFKALRNEKDYLENDLLQKKEQVQTLQELLKKTKGQLEDTGSTLVMFNSREQRQLEELGQVKVELNNRDRKIKFLEDTLDRQRKNNALIKADYREVDFTRVPNVPVTVDPSPSSPSKPVHSRCASRAPLADFKSNEESKARKRAHSVCDNENVEYPAPKSSRRNPLDGAYRTESQPRQTEYYPTRTGRPKLSSRNNSYLPTPSSSSSENHL